jgi:hypothetical protein
MFIIEISFNDKKHGYAILQAHYNVGCPGDVEHLLQRIPD